MITAIDKNTALVLIDLQNGIAKNRTKEPVKSVLKRSAQLAAAFRRAGLPVIIVSVGLSADADWIHSRKDDKRSMLPKSRIMLGIIKMLLKIRCFSKIVSEIRTQPTDIFITKYTLNAFYRTALQEELQKRNITGIVIAGISASAGVEGTARAAAERGYSISFAVDAMSDRELKAQEISIRHIFPRLGEVGTTEEIISKMQNRV